MGRPACRIEGEPGGDCYRLRISGTLDLTTAPLLLQKAADLLAAGEDDLLLDLRGVSLLDSSGLSCLLTIHHRVQERDGWLGVVVPPGPVREVFTLTGVEALLCPAATEEEVLAQRQRLD